MAIPREACPNSVYGAAEQSLDFTDRRAAANRMEETLCARNSARENQIRAGREILPASRERFAPLCMPRALSCRYALEPAGYRKEDSGLGPPERHDC